MSSPAAPASTRLHIAPCTPELFRVIIPPSLTPVATNVSHHTVQTFPEKSFAFVDLPTAEADKLRKKLNGSTLKGFKISIEPAREEGRMKRAREAAETESSPKDARTTEERRAKKRKRQDGELPGWELPEGRAVKRGWADKGKSRPSKDKVSKDGKKAAAVDKDKSALLFRTKVPPNAATNLDDAARKKKQKRGTVDVKEFASAKPVLSFLRQDKASQSTSKPLEFVEGKGWVDEAGEVVEAAKPTQKPSLSAQQQHEKRPRKVAKQPVVEEDDSSSEESSVVSSSSSDSEDESDEEDEKTDGSDEDGEMEDAPPVRLSTPAPINTESTAEATSAIHPLEALFKRPTSRDKDKPAPPPIQTTFSFFGDGPVEDDDDNENEASDQPPEDHSNLVHPLTPYTRRDREGREIRSAAPTPDTAAIGKRFSRMPWAEESSDEDSEAEGVESIKPSGASSQTSRSLAKDEISTEDLIKPANPDSDWAKEFEANRGEWNRMWKARKQQARKDRRQAENRKAGFNKTAK